MTSFAHWWTGGRTKDPKQIYYLLGPERVLVDHIIEHLLDAWKATPSNLVGVRFGDYSESLAWAQLEQAPLDPRSPRVLVLRDVDRAKHWTRLQNWLTHKRWYPNTRVILVSGEEKLERLPTEEGGFANAEHIQALRKAGAGIITCDEFTERSAAVAVQWVQSLYGMPPNVAGHLLNRANGNLRIVRDAVVKLRALEQAASIPLVNDLVPQAPRDEFVDALIHRDRRTALAQLKRVRNAEYRRELGRLDAQLTFMSQLHHLQARGASYADMARELQGRAFLIKEFLDDAKNYDDKAIMRRRSLVALCDGILLRIRSTQVTAVMETLVLNW